MFRWDRDLRHKCNFLVSPWTGLRDIIEKAIRASYALQTRDDDLPFSASDMASDIIDALRQSGGKAAT